MARTGRSSSIPVLFISSVRKITHGCEDERYGRPKPHVCETRTGGSDERGEAADEKYNHRHEWFRKGECSTNQEQERNQYADSSRAASIFVTKNGASDTDSTRLYSHDDHEYQRDDTCCDFHVDTSLDEILNPPGSIP
jgi:hypothetical protein